MKMKKENKIILLMLLINPLVFFIAGFAYGIISTGNFDRATNDGLLAIFYPVLGVFILLFNNMGNTANGLGTSNVLSQSIVIYSGVTFVYIMTPLLVFIILDKVIKKN